LALAKNLNRNRWDADNAYLILQKSRYLKLIEFFPLAIGAVIGAYLGHRIVESPVAVYGLPVKVLTVNVLGSFALILFLILSIGLNFYSKYTLITAVGFCCSFTTISSFALETNNLLYNNRFGLVALNIIANVGLSLGAIFRGRMLCWRSFLVENENVGANN